MGSRPGCSDSGNYAESKVRIQRHSPGSPMALIPVSRQIRTDINMCCFASFSYFSSSTRSISHNRPNQIPLQNPSLSKYTRLSQCCASPHSKSPSPSSSPEPPSSQRHPTCRLTTLSWRACSKNDRIVRAAPSPERLVSTLAPTGVAARSAWKQQTAQVFLSRCKVHGVLTEYCSSSSCFLSCSKGRT